MDYQGDELEGYQGQFGALPALAVPLIVGGTAAAGYGLYELIKPKDQNTGTQYIPSGRSLKGRTRMPPDGRMAWTTPEDMDSIVITIVDGADTVLRKVQVFSVKSLRTTLPGAPTNVETWDKRFIGWKGSGAGKWFKGRPDLVDFYYYVDGDLKQEPYDEQVAINLQKQTGSASDISKTATEQGNLTLAEQYQKLAAQLAQKTGQAADKAGTDTAKQAAEMAAAAALQAQATLQETLRMIKGQTDNGNGMPSWVWIAVAAGAVFLFMKR